MSRVVMAIVMSMALTLAACGDGVGGGDGDVLHTVGGSISGLSASGLVLANGGDTRSVEAGATSFTLPTTLVAGSSFNVVVQTQPIGQTCSVTGGSGAVGSANVTSVVVTCSANTFTLGGSISGLTASGLVLENGSETLEVEADASELTFLNALTSGSNFDIRVQSQPAGLICSVANGSGVVSNANVNNAVVTCNVNAFTLGGSIEGFSTYGLVLVNGGDTLIVEAGASSFTLPAPVASGGGFEVRVQSQPAGQSCSVSNGSGLMGEADITSVTVTCGSSLFTVGGSIRGHRASGLVLENGGDTLDVEAEASSFTFEVPVAFGSSFNVTVQSQPSGLICSVFNGSGTMDAANVTSVEVTCDANAYTLGGSISGLTASGLELINGSDTLTVIANDSRFTLSTPVASGSSFNVIVHAQPSGLTCTVFNGSGAMGAANVTSVVVTCGPNAFTLGGALSGLTSNGLELANGSDTLSVAARATTFSMPSAVVVGSPFEVTVQTHADEDTCNVSNGSGTMGNADFSSVSVACVLATFTVSTFAGSTTRIGSADGGGTAASFNGPWAVAVDSVGNLYVADSGNHKIRKITPAGVVSTLAGSGAVGSANGVGTASSFNHPQDIAVDGSGNVYVADTYNHKIRKITPAGWVSTLAGSGAAGSTNGVGIAAWFNRPHGIAVDGSGNVYVADTNNHKIRKITPLGGVSTFAGSGAVGSANGVGAATSFNFPSGLAVDNSGAVYVADRNNYRIRKITPTGDVSTLAGSGAVGSDNGNGTAASFRNPLDVAVDARGTVFVADTGSNNIRKITPVGEVSTFAGSGAIGSSDGSGTLASFYTPTGVAVDASGSVYVADLGNQKIRKITPLGGVSTFAGSGAVGSDDGTGTAASFFSPYGIAVDSGGNFFVTDIGSDKVRKITPAGIVSTIAGSGVEGSDDGIGTAASFEDPTGIAVDASGTLYVADTANQKIRKITPAGVVSTFAGSGAEGSADGRSTAASFHAPVGVAVDGSGTLYVADRDSHKIRKITSRGVVSTIAGSGAVGSEDGIGMAASFNLPTGIAVDGSGTLYVTDTGSNKIRKITPAGAVSTLAGSGAQGSDDGIGMAASFNFPTGIAVAGSGTVYLTESRNHKIRKITAAGVVSTFAGSGEAGSTDGSAAAASFFGPDGVVIDSSGNLHVTDRGNHIIRKIARD